MNRLAGEKSPYLLQHANNPVDWRPWGEEAFAAARAEDKPIFLSIGYSTCHWCHVMERESFENESIAEVLNGDFISIKLDREERPDIDRIYMMFVQATTGSGGWPMSVWLTPDLKPFYGGTYFPPENRYGRPGFRTVLQQLANAWKTDRPRILDSTDSMLESLRHNNYSSPGEGVIDTRKVAETIYHGMSRSFDKNLGGFGAAPKFPRPVTLNFLLRHYLVTKTEDSLEMAVKTLQEMALGGMNDQLGGGFHRYSVDAQWFVPHFEKMLYDQAQLVNAYIEAYQLTGNKALAQTARETLDYVLRDLRHPEGAFYSAEDADSVIDPAHPHEKGEGAFYIWSWEELESIVGADRMPWFAKRFGIERNGNVHEDPHAEFTGKNILYLSNPDTDPLPEELRAKLLAARNQRVRPHLDDKVLTSWNALMISAFVTAGRALNEPRYLDAAIAATKFIEDKLLTANGILLRRYRDGEAAIPGFLDDYASFAYALIDLYEATANEHYIDLARKLAGDMTDLFEDHEAGGFYSTTEADANVLLRIKDDYDGAEPSGNSIAAQVLLRLGEDPEKTFRAFAKRMGTMPRMVGALLALPPRQIILEGEDVSEYRKVLDKRFLPFHRILYRPEGQKPGAYVCENFVCQLPVHNGSDLEALLNSTHV
ncbi:thioredoxin domain-containing protein [Bryobacter aggregatus]|uniref:thioredoxin domain-containing protein n=1 Tax=Bryobacter aggregatus TaxID=360054 RepID=UPI0004E1D721|nr:thioredoxin domain-containing protein [Bryobacter aggregatus]